MTILFFLLIVSSNGVHYSQNITFHLVFYDSEKYIKV